MNLRAGDKAAERHTGITLSSEKSVALSQNDKRNDYGEWYQKIVETAQEGIWVVDQTGKIIYANDRMVEMLGYAPEQIQGRPFFDFMDPGTSAEALKDFQQRKEGRKKRSDSRLVRKDGTSVWVLVNSSPISDKNNGFSGVLMMATDITERKKTETQLNFLASIVKAMPDPVCSIDLNGRIIAWNESAANVLGYAAEEVIGKPVTMILPGDKADRELTHCVETLNTQGCLTGYESLRVAKGGNTVPVEITAVAMRDEDGGITGYASVMRDISERKRNEESLLKAVRHAEDERAKIEAIIDAIGDGIRILGTDFRILYENRAHKDLLGSHEGERCYRAYRDREEICEGCGVAESFLDGKIRRLERRAPTGRGTAHLEITASPIRDASGKIIAGIEVIRDATERKKAELEREKLIRELTEAMEKIKTLRGLLHTCAWCRKIRDDKGSWNRAETYIEKHSDARFTHGICPDCLKKYSPEAYEDLLNSPEAYEKLLETYRDILESDAGDDRLYP